MLVNDLTRGLVGPIRSHANHALLMTQTIFVSDGCPRLRRSSTVIRPIARASRIAFLLAVDLHTPALAAMARSRQLSLVMGFVFFLCVTPIGFIVRPRKDVLLLPSLRQLLSTFYALNTETAFRRQSWCGQNCCVRSTGLGPFWGDCFT